MIDGTIKHEAALLERVKDAVRLYRMERKGSGKTASAADQLEDQKTVELVMAQVMGRTVPATVQEEYERLYLLTRTMAPALHWLASSGPDQQVNAAAAESLLVMGRIEQKRMLDMLSTFLGFDIGDIRDAVHSLPPELLQDFGERIDAVLGRALVDTSEPCTCGHPFSHHDPRTKACTNSLCFCQRYVSPGSIGL